jgi:transcriptional regulator GlxA family with amidase domain
MLTRDRGNDEWRYCHQTRYFRLMVQISSRVGLLVYDGCFASEAFTVLDMLALANRVAEFSGGNAPFTTSVHAVRPGLVSASGGIAVRAQRMDYGLDLLVIPGFDLSPAQDVAQRLDAWRSETALLRRVSERGIRTASICVGAFLLAAAGLLDERRATTAWLLADVLQEQYPRITVDRNALLVEDGPVTTAGAFSAGSDLALHLVRLHSGASVARRTSRITLTAGRISQTPFIDDTLIDNAQGAFSAEVRHYLMANLDNEYDLTKLATAHHVSTRTMLRRFRAETGQTPLDYLQSARVSRARQLLESTDLSVVEVARAVGYHDTSTFRRLFAGLVGLRPSEYRRTFGGRREPI